MTTESISNEAASKFSSTSQLLLQVRLGDFHSALECYTKAADLAPGISGTACPSNVAFEAQKSLLMSKKCKHENASSKVHSKFTLAWCSGYRLREAELMFQDGQADKSDRVMRGVVRKNPNYAGELFFMRMNRCYGQKSHALASSRYLPFKAH